MVPDLAGKKEIIMKKLSSAPTMKDVAREAGVALGTVSKVINGIPVGEEYKKRVESAVKKLDYRINSYAQGMKAGRTFTAALLIPNTREPFFADLTYQINLVFLRRKYRMLLCCTESDPSLEQEYVNMVQQNKADGIIALTYNTGLVIEEGTAFVSIDCSVGPEFPCVASDNFAGGQLAAEKLADFGCKRVAFLRAGASLVNEPNKRQAGFLNGCLLRNLHYEMKVVREGESYDGFREFLARQIKDGKMTLDGIFCMTDGLAYFVIQELEGLGLKVPEDVQVIGFDGIRVFGDKNYLCSTIVQPVREIAEMCVEQLLRDGRMEKPPLICLPVTYGYGGTTLAES